jgi:prophage regulatory protein
MATDLPISALRFLRRPEVEALTGMVGAQIDKMIRAGTFPSPVPLTERIVGWAEYEVRAWLIARLAARAADDEARRVGRTPPAVRHRYQREREDEDTSAPA